MILATPSIVTALPTTEPIHVNEAKDSTASTHTALPIQVVETVTLTSYATSTAVNVQVVTVTEVATEFGLAVIPTALGTQVEKADAKDAVEGVD